jgi:hypothetical protein
MSTSRNRGLRSPVSAACRAALRDAGSESRSPLTKQHLEECSFCASRWKASDTLAGLCKQRPSVPPGLSSEAFLEGVFARVAESFEEGPLGDWLQKAPVEPHADDAASSTLSDAIKNRGGINEEVVGDLLRGPQLPDPHVWTGVRRSILSGVASERSVQTRYKPSHWRVFLAGAAAAALIGFIATSGESIPAPTIVFADLDRAPDIDFAIVRYGSRR